MVGSSFEYMFYGFVRIIVSTLPWLLVAIIGFLAYLRTRSLPTLIQAIGAAILFLGGILFLLLSYLLPYLLNTMGLSISMYSRILQIAGIILFGLGTILFTIGYFAEKIRQGRDAHLSAIPVSQLAELHRT